MQRNKRVIVQGLDWAVRLSHAFERFVRTWLQGLGLANRCLSGADFTRYRLRWLNLRGTDFSGCNLQYANFKGVIGGFSWVRPLLVLAVISGAMSMTYTIIPDLEDILQPLQGSLGVPRSVGPMFVGSMAVMLYLKMALALLYGNIELPLGIAQSQDAKPGLWTLFNQSTQVALVLISFWLSLGAYLIIQTALVTVSLSWFIKLGLLTIGTLLSAAAIATITRLLGKAFIFRTCFIKANLDSACLIQARFPRCNFYKASLRAANLQGGDFSRCNFQGADLRFSDWRGANLRGAKLSGAWTDGAVGLEEALYGC